MRLKVLGLAGMVLCVAACSRRGDVSVLFLGTTPTNSRVTDQRAVEFHCPACGKVLTTTGDVKCPDRNCAARILWESEVACDYCAGTGACSTCRIMGQSKSECYNCGGNGYLSMEGRTPPCKNCNGAKKCPVCKGSNQCDFCKGAGKIAVSELKAKVRAQAPADSEK